MDVKVNPCLDFTIPDSNILDIVDKAFKEGEFDYFDDAVSDQVENIFGTLADNWFSDLDLESACRDALDIPHNLDKRLDDLEESMERLEKTEDGDVRNDIDRLTKTVDDLQDTAADVERHADTLQALDERILRIENAHKAMVPIEVKFDENIAREVTEQGKQIKLLAGYISSILSTLNNVDSAISGVNSIDSNPLEALLNQ